MAGATMRPMGIGEVLDRSFQVLRRHLGTLAATALIGFVPALLISGLLGTPYGAPIAEEQMSGGAAAGLILMLGVMMLGTAIIWGALTRQVDQAVSGGPVTVGDGLRTGVRALLRFIGAGILAYLAILAIAIPVGILLALVIPLVMATVGDGAVGIALAAVLVGVPLAIGIVVYIGWVFLFTPALIIEGLGPIGSLRRANELAKGGRLRVFATAFMSWCVVLLPALGIPFLLGMGLAMWDPQAAGEATTTQLYLYQILTFGVSALTTPFIVAAMVHSYYDRRVRREGYDLEVGPAAMTAPA